MGKSAPAGQLSLFDLIEDEQAQDDLSTQAQWHREVPEYIVTQHSWADGNTSPAQLERLSHVLLGEPEIMARSDSHEKYKYRIVTTSVIGQKVWCGCQIIGPLIASGDDEE